MTQQYRLTSPFCLVFLHKHSSLWIPPQVPLKAISPQSTADLSLGLPSTLCPSSQPLHFLGDLHPCPGMCGCNKIACMISFHSECPGLAVSLSSIQRLHFCPKELSHVGIWPQLHLSHPQLQIQSYSLPLFSASFLCPTKSCVVLYILFQRSGTPACSQLSSARSSASGGVFLMYTWRQMHSIFAYSRHRIYCCCFYIELHEIYILEINPSMIALQIFSPIMWIVVFIFCIVSFAVQIFCNELGPIHLFLF